MANLITEVIKKQVHDRFDIIPAAMHGWGDGNRGWFIQITDKKGLVTDDDYYDYDPIIQDKDVAFKLRLSLSDYRKMIKKHRGHFLAKSYGQFFFREKDQCLPLIADVYKRLYELANCKGGIT